MSVETPASGAGTAGAPAHLRLLPAPSPAYFERYQVGGVSLSASRFREAVDFLLAAPRRGLKLRVHFCAVHTLVEASKDPALREALNEADFLAPDGMPLVWAGRLKGKEIERICGPDTMLEILDRSRLPGQRHFFYGGTPQVLDDLVAKMTERFPGLQVAGAYSPPFRPLTWDEAESVVQTINESRADYVWVGLGSPKQDQWLATFRPLLNASVLLSVGAAFDYHAGRRSRAPLWAQRSGLEWAFRLLSEPRRLLWRYTVTSLQFAFLVRPRRRRRREAGLR